MHGLVCNSQRMIKAWIMRGMKVVPFEITQNGKYHEYFRNTNAITVSLTTMKLKKAGVFRGVKTENS